MRTTRKRFSVMGSLVLILTVTLAYGQTFAAAHSGPQMGNSDSVLNAHLLETSALNSTNDSSPCGLLAAEYGGGGFPYYSNYSIMFSNLCKTAQFETLYEGMGVSGFFDIGQSGQTGEVPNLWLALNWAGNCTNASIGLGGNQCSFTAYWVGYLSNNSLAGPYVIEGPLINMGGPPPTAVAGASPPSSSLWWLLVGVALVTLFASSVILTTRRRQATRDSILADDEDEDLEPPPAAVASTRISEKGTRSTHELTSPREETTDTLDDVF
jgi:hypothetical protein